jgi:glycosyltransferase involved in cell wall biosynthesis
MEIICVDDGSKDDSVAILNQYRNRINVVQQVNTGQAGHETHLHILQDAKTV